MEQQSNTFLIGNSKMYFHIFQAGHLVKIRILYCYRCSIYLHWLAQNSLKTSAPFPQVTQLAGYFEPLIVASVGVASKLKDHQQQMTFLDQTKTLAESALQMLYAAKEGGGNPKVSSFHNVLLLVPRATNTD